MNIRKHIPNAITSMNLLCGAIGVVFAFKGRFDVGFFLMLGALVFDFCDGLAARLLGAYSPMGKELDSLADMVSFGVLPAVLLHNLMLALGCTRQGCPEFVCYIPLVLAVFSGLRLAKFNVDERQSESFIGLATPSSAIICGSLAAFCYFRPGAQLADILSAWFTIPLIALALSALVVSEIPMFSFKFGKGVKADFATRAKRIAFLSICAVALAVVPALGGHWTLLPLLFVLAYVVENLVCALFRI